MKSNASLTLYNRYVDPTTHGEKYQRTQISDIYWENRKAANVLRSGNLEADSVAVYIPFWKGLYYLASKAWQALTVKTGKWTLQVGDYLVKGLVTDEITGAFTVTSLKEKYDDVVKITSVDTFDQGSPSMHHWQVGGA